MKKHKTNTVPTKNAKISDFFSKLHPNSSHGVREAHDSKRKLSCTKQSPESQVRVLNSVTNLPLKREHSLSPPDCKKVKHDENCEYQTMTQLKSNGVEEFSNNIVKTEPTDEESSNNCKLKTPEKPIKPSSIMATPTPKKGSSAGKNRTPQGSKSGTPSKKLFQKSPRNLAEFNVQVLEDFVKISPSTSNKIIRVRGTPSKFHDLTSPSKGSTPRTTPLKSPGLLRPVTPQIRTKLKFTSCDLNDDPKTQTMTECELKAEIDAAFIGLDDEDFNFIEDEHTDKLNFKDPQHCKIVKIEKSANEIVLTLESSKSKDIGVCKVQEFWSSTNHYKVGDKVYVTAVKGSDDKWVVNNQAGWLVYEPDVLISCTTVVGSLFCKRRSVLAERFRGFEPGNRIMLLGVLVHTLLQTVLKQNLKARQEIEAALQNILKSEDTIKRLYEINLTFSQIEPELLEFVPKIEDFMRQYVNNNSKTRRDPKQWNGKICKIDDIEENILCPELGIKGKVDVTVRTETNIMPLELKTGRATVSLEHRGQVMLYIMMMNRFGYRVSSGLLLYLREGVLKEIESTPQEKRDIIILRNELAYYLTRNATKDNPGAPAKPPELPEPINHHSACSKCAYSVICTSFLKNDGYDFSTNKSLEKVHSEVTSHLTEDHLNYFIHWSTLLSMEDENNSGFKSLQEIYTVEAAKRESQGKCIINMKVVSVGTECNSLVEHTFEKSSSDKRVSLITFGISQSNYVVVSTDSRPGVAAGFVTDITSATITIVLDRNLNKKYQGKLFHLDTYDSSVSHSFNLTSLSLLLENSPRAQELRNIIIDKAPPSFASKLPAVVAKRGAPILRRLNHIQQKAILKVLSAKDFFLINGMPGTGKTETIVALIQLLVELNKTVIITSHTHSAIDNICTRLLKYNVDFIRLGSESRIDKGLKSKSEANLTKGCTTPEQLEEIYNSYKVIAVTCLGSGHPVLSKRTVDYCIVDESTQVLQTSVIKPIYSAKTFILIGDPDQLAPVVRNRDAVNAGMAESLFERLSGSTGGTIALNLTYRMNRVITDLANTFTYQGQLQTANDSVANASVEIPNIQSLKSSYQQHLWLLTALDPSLDASVRFIDTGPVWKLPQNMDLLSSKTKTKESDPLNCVNVYEVAVVKMLIDALIQGGVCHTDIGVIATYRAQVAQISSVLSKTNVEVSTVDQFQGRDKKIIIYSCAKSKDMSKTTSEVQKFELLEDRRRLTVAITRAKHKLIMIGDVSTLRSYTTFASIFAALDGNNIVQVDSEWSSFDCL